MLQICGDMLTYSRSYSVVLISDIRHILDIDMMKNLSFSCKTDCGHFTSHIGSIKDTSPASIAFSTVFAIELRDFHKLSDSGKNEFLPKKIGDSVTNFHSIANFTGLPGLYATAYSSYSF